ncbi:MAG: monovalent cation/H(+) antiporter subunit G [Planctomycetota bacterium]
MTEGLAIILNLLSAAALVFGLFFLFVGALGIFRLPDAYNRMHAASKSITLGIVSLLLAAVLHLSAPDGDMSRADVIGAITKAILVIIFQFIAAPVASHMLAKAAHMDGAGQAPSTAADELAEDHAPVDDSA